jgi:adenylate cyclase
MDPPIAILAAAAPVANVVQRNDADGLMRRHMPFVLHEGRLYPSLPLRAWMAGHPGFPAHLAGDTLVLDDKRVPLDEDASHPIRYHGAGDAYPHVAAHEIFRSIVLKDEGKPPSIPPETFKGKYVIVSASAHALRDIRVSPISRLHLGAAINAAALDNLLQGDFVARTPRHVDALLALGLALLLAVAMVFVWSSIPSNLGAFAATTLATVVVLVGYVYLSFRLYDARGLWMPVAIPVSGAAVATFVALLVVQSLERRDRRFVQEALGRYTSDELVKELIAHPEHLSLEWGEQREMSVYFSDIAGFTTISEGLDAKRLVALLNDYLTHMTDIVLAHGGVVDKYIGDAIMAFWGAPLPAQDHAVRAVRCSLAMRARCLELKPVWERDYGQTVMARAGVNSGPAVVGNMGSKHKYNYTVMGDMVNLASRLEGANKPYGTLLMISEFTYAKVKDVFAVRELDKMTVKGKEQPVTVYEVLAEKGQVDPAVAETVRRFHEALAHYRERRFADAMRVFEENRGDAPSTLYIERCKHFLAEPPPAEWDGVWHMKEK